MREKTFKRLLRDRISDVHVNAHVRNSKPLRRRKKYALNVFAISFSNISLLLSSTNAWATIARAKIQYHGDEGSSMDDAIYIGLSEV